MRLSAVSPYTNTPNRFGANKTVKAVLVTTAALALGLAASTYATHTTAKAIGFEPAGVQNNNNEENRQATKVENAVTALLKHNNVNGNLLKRTNKIGTVNGFNKFETKAFHFYKDQLEYWTCQAVFYNDNNIKGDPVKLTKTYNIGDTFTLEGDNFVVRQNGLYLKTRQGETLVLKK